MLLSNKDELQVIKTITGNILSRIARILSKRVKITVCKTLILPHFTFCASLIITVKKLDRLQKMQNRDMTVILSKPREITMRDMLKELKCVCVKDYVYYRTMVLVYKMNKNLSPNYLEYNVEI